MPKNTLSLKTSLTTFSILALLATGLLYTKGAVADELAKADSATPQCISTQIGEDTIIQCNIKPQIQANEKLYGVCMPGGIYLELKRLDTAQMDLQKQSITKNNESIFKSRSYKFAKYLIPTPNDGACLSFPSGKYIVAPNNISSGYVRITMPNTIYSDKILTGLNTYGLKVAKNPIKEDDQSAESDEEKLIGFDFR